MEEMIKALTNDKINLIGICGLPGVGKTTMAKEVAKRAKEDGLFVEVASTSVGQKPNIGDVQASIADMLGLKELGDRANPEVRADLLRERLLQDDKKILVLLDDIWEEIDLEGMGIPLGGTNKNFKMLYTSRTRYLWHDPQTKEEILLEVLSEEEAWKLFKEKVGDSADAQDLQPIAKQIVNECGRLPLALVLIGSALSKKSGRNAIEMWKGMLDRLTCAISIPADERLYSRLELSYEYLDDKEAKRLFLLCCLFKEDEDICIEDLTRYGFGLSLFDGINEMEKVRSQVFLIVHDLKSRYLLLDSKEECVKVHDVVRDMGISIASKDKYALVSHGATSDWPKKGTYEHYAAISVMSRTITELPEGLACPNLELLMLECGALEKPPCNFFEGMGKLKVLKLNHFGGIMKLQSLTNLETLSLEYYHGDVLNNVSGFGALVNLEILSFRNSSVKELPEELGELVNLRLLDLRNTSSLERIPSGVISRLVHLEELYLIDSNFQDWEGEGKEEGRNANLREFESLSNLNTLEILIRADVLLPKVPIFSKLKIYKVVIMYDDDGTDDGSDDGTDDSSDDGTDDKIGELMEECKRVLVVRASIPIPLDRGGIDSLVRSSDCLLLHWKGCNYLVQELLWNGVDVLQQLKSVSISSSCDTLECLVNTMNPVHLPTASAVFPILQLLDLNRLANLRELCRGPVPAHSFGELNFIRVQNCGRLGSLFQLSIVGCLTQLKDLIIRSCGMMEEVFIWKEQRVDVHVTTSNRIEFPKLKVLKLEKLQSLLGFCRGIDQIDFPELERLDLQDLGQLNHLFHSNSNQSSDSEQNDDVGIHYLFPRKVSLPNLMDLELTDCNKLQYVFSPSMMKSIPQLSKLHILRCEMLSRIVAEENELGESTVAEVEFPQLKWVELCDLPNLVSFFPNVNTTTLAKSTDHYHNPLQPQPLFNEKVAIPSLEYLELSGLENVGDLWSSELPTGLFSKLKVLDVRYCLSLRNMFHPSMARGLLNLQNLLVSDCSTLEAVVGKEEQVGGHGRKIEKTLFPELGKLQLRRLPHLRRFCHFTHPLEIPLLSELVILDCPSMHVFSLEPVNAPNLSSPHTSWKGNLNNAIPLLQEVSLPNLKVLNLAKFENLERLGDDPLLGSLSQLKEFSVRDCGKLLCVVPSQLLSMLQDLEYLIVECCNLLEVVFEFEGGDYNGPNPETLPPLKLVKLSNLPKLNYISKRDPMGFKYIQALDIDNCNRLRYVFSPTMTKSIPQLHKLKISNCEMLSRIVAEENELGESTVAEVEFPQLERVELRDLPNLVSFFPNVNTTTLAKLQPQPLFNEKVSIPSLEYLVLSGLENVSDLWSSELPTGLFSKLKVLKVWYCLSLRNMFHPSMARGLLNLQDLFISDCSTLEAVVGKEEQVGGQGRKIKKTLFPKLEELRLLRLPYLRRFCHCTHPLEIPLLSEVDIVDCPNMDAFSLEPVSAPKLSYPDISCKGDLNNAIPILQEIERKRKENWRKEEEKEKDREDGDQDEGTDRDEDEGTDGDEDKNGDGDDQEEKRKEEEEEETTEKGRKRKWTDLDEDEED